jgi:hypothetical protein
MVFYESHKHLDLYEINLVTKKSVSFRVAPV